jgi:cellulose synthase/poly-beta-1,6-N-acetylglucosamine synthase-like glycosyltransferase
MIVWLGIFSGLLIFQYVLLLVLLMVNWKNHVRKTNQIPKVSVLIAARNEAKTLPLLLSSLEKLDYPDGKLEILIAEDQSEDQTPQILADWVQTGNNRKLISISSDQTDYRKKNGKANALAILCKEASGELFFFTDADCEVPEKWIQEGIACFDGETVLVLGITQVKSTNYFEKMQEIDWWNTLGVVKMVTDLKLPTTGLGNNMVISRQAYLASGGYEKIPFSLTEDLELSKAIRNAGYKIRHQVSENFLVNTKAEKDLLSLLDQRKRWMTGAMTLSPSWKILLSLQFLYFPAVLYLVALNWQLGLFIFSAKIIFQSFFLVIFSNKTAKKLGVFHTLFFDFYQIWNLSLTILYYFWPVRIEWKARKYI